MTGAPGGDGTADAPQATVWAWAEAWRRLDRDVLVDLFVGGATYVAVLSGPVDDLPRAFTAATRTWARCDVDDLRLSPATTDGDDAVVRAAYRFSGTTRGGRDVAYAATATFTLRRKPSEGWRITAFHESRARP